MHVKSISSYPHQFSFQTSVLMLKRIQPFNTFLNFFSEMNVYCKTKLNSAKKIIYLFLCASSVENLYDQAVIRIDNAKT